MSSGNIELLRQQVRQHYMSSSRQSPFLLYAADITDVQNPVLGDEPVWAHPVEQIERGGILLASPKAPELLSDPRMWQVVPCFTYLTKHLGRLYCPIASIADWGCIACSWWSWFWSTARPSAGASF